MSSQPDGAILLVNSMLKLTAGLILENFFVAHIEDSDMWGVFSAFDIPVLPRSEWYTEEQANEVARKEEAIWQSKRSY